MEGRRTSRSSLYFLAVKDAIYTALFGAPEIHPETSWDGVGGTLANVTASALHGAASGAKGALHSASSSLLGGAASGLKVIESTAGSVTNWTSSKAQELAAFFTGSSLPSGERKDEPEIQETPQRDQRPWHPPLLPPALATVEVEQAIVNGVKTDEVATMSQPLFTDLDGSGAEPGDFFLFIKDYGWSLRYRISRAEDSVNIERPLLLDWIKLRQPVRHPSDLLEIPSADLFQWDVVEPPRHSGFMYQVTQVMGSGVEAVINFFKDRGPKLLVQQEGVSLVDSDGEAPPDVDIHRKPVTHCWVQCLGLPFLPVLQYIAFLNHDEVVTDWHA